MNLPDIDIATIVLSAGSSARLGMHKALLDLGGESAVCRIARAVLSSKSNRCLIVLGACRDDIRLNLEGLPVEIVENPDFTSGRTGSIKCALRSLGASLNTTAVVLFPVDCPFVPPAFLNRLVECFLAQRSAFKESFWIVPEFKGRNGHPILLAGPVLSAILELDDSHSLRVFLHAEKEKRLLRCIKLPAPNEAVLDNINSREDVVRIFKREGLILSPPH